MADYYTPTVVQQTIPLADMTPLETLILKAMFDSETIAGELYFFGEERTNDVLSFTPAELRDAIEQSGNTPSCIYDAVKGELDGAAPSAEDIDVDLTEVTWSGIFQDIVKRSPTLTHISVMASFTCSKMRNDAFGGMVTLITPAKILSMSTNEILEKWLSDEFP